MSYDYILMCQLSHTPSYDEVVPFWPPELHVVPMPDLFALNVGRLVALTLGHESASLHLFGRHIDTNDRDFLTEAGERMRRAGRPTDAHKSPYAQALSESNTRYTVGCQGSVQVAAGQLFVLGLARALGGFLSDPQRRTIRSFKQTEQE
jgi:hypothetical protein